MAVARIRPTHSHCPTEHRPRTLQHTRPLGPTREPPSQACARQAGVQSNQRHLSCVRARMDVVGHRTRPTPPFHPRPFTDASTSSDSTYNPPGNPVPGSAKANRPYQLLQFGRTEATGRKPLPLIRQRPEARCEPEHPTLGGDPTPQPLLSRPRFAPIRPRTPPLPLTDSGDGNQRARSSSTHTQDPMPPPTPLQEQSNTPSRHIGHRWIAYLARLGKSGTPAGDGYVCGLTMRYP